jgi:hypothetical protein
VLLIAAATAVAALIRADCHGGAAASTGVLANRAKRRPPCILAIKIYL